MKHPSTAVANGTPVRARPPLSRAVPLPPQSQS